MMNKSFQKLRSTLLPFLLVIALFVSTKIYQFAVAPTKPKVCPFIYPDHNDQTKPTHIQMEVPKNLLTLEQSGGVVNDASCLNKTSVYGVVKITSVDDVRDALEFARTNEIPVTSAGQQHSMGGQSFVQNGLVLNMKGLQEMELNKEQKILRVQSGALWADVQKFLDQEGFAVKAMQSINIFTVGGTISVNAHGIAHEPGPISSTIQSMRVMMSDGTIVTTSPTENTELFRAVIGGYGLFGVILDADLAVVENELYRWQRVFMKEKDFPKYYSDSIENQDEIGLLYGRLSMSPTSYLDETIIHRYEKIETPNQTPPLQFPTHSWINRLVINFSKTGSVGRWVRWMLEKYVEPRVHVCSRNEAMSQTDVCLVTRNQEMYDAMPYLKNTLKDTDILQEYFIPHDRMSEFVSGLKHIVKKNRSNLLNVTLRLVREDHLSTLAYAKGDRFAFVLYFNQKFNRKESEKLKQTTIDLIDLSTNLGGTYYLPYQLYASKEQLKKAYPEIDAFFALKEKYDPMKLFTNKFYQKYGPS